MDKESYGKCSKWKLSWKHVVAGIFKDGGFVKFSEHFFVKIDVFQTKVIQASTCGADASTCSKVSFSTTDQECYVKLKGRLYKETKISGSVSY